MLGSMVYSTTNLNTTIPGMTGYNQNQDFMKKMIDGQKEAQEFFWLYKG